MSKYSWGKDCNLGREGAFIKWESYATMEPSFD